MCWRSLLNITFTTNFTNCPNSIDSICRKTMQKKKHTINLPKFHYCLQAFITGDTDQRYRILGFGHWIHIDHHGSQLGQYFNNFCHSTFRFIACTVLSTWSVENLFHNFCHDPLLWIIPSFTALFEKNLEKNSRSNSPPFINLFDIISKADVLRIINTVFQEYSVWLTQCANHVAATW